MKKEQIDALMAQVHLYSTSRKINNFKLVEQGVDFLWHLRSQASATSTETKMADGPEALGVQTLVKRAFCSPLTGAALATFTDKALDEMTRLLTMIRGSTGILPEADQKKLLTFLQALGGNFSPPTPPSPQQEMAPPTIVQQESAPAPTPPAVETPDPETDSPITKSSRTRQSRRVRGITVGEGQELPIGLKENVEYDPPKED